MDEVDDSLEMLLLDSVDLLELDLLDLLTLSLDELFVVLSFGELQAAIEKDKNRNKDILRNFDIDNLDISVTSFLFSAIIIVLFIPKNQVV